MFKRLRERIAEEATKFPVGQLNNSNTGKQLSDSESKAAGATSTEDLITLSDSSAVVVPHTSSQQFSIGEDEDGSISEQSTPQRKQNESANGSTNEHSFYSPSSRDHPAGTGSDFFGQEYKPSKSNYIPQSDIESEREDPPTLNLEGISKDQLLSAIEILKARGHKYKNKYVEVKLREEKLKIETTLIEQQDKALRRMAELREQCHLEQKAKAHLEANLRLTLEEKDSRICVLETQINLLKENPKPLSDVNETHNSDACGNTLLDSSVTNTLDSSLLEEKLDKLEHQLNQANKTITAQTDQISLLRKQNEGISQELEEKMSRLNEMEDEEGQLKSKHEFILQGLQNRLKELETQQEESLMAMAETKKNMHEELEFKEKQLVLAEEEAKQFQASYEAEKQKVLELQKQHEEKINTLQHQLESTESMLEEEKQNLMQELARGKSAAITLVQQECNKKIAAVEEEWKIKLEEEKLRQQKQTVEELNSIIEQLENENATLKTSLEKVQSDLALSSTEINKLQTAYMDLKDLSDKKSLQYEEQLKKERNNRLQNEQSESELCSRYKSLKEQLDEKQNMLDDMIQSKDSLIIQINELEKREKQLMDEIEILKKESFLKCQNLTSKLEVFSDYDDLKNQINLHEKKKEKQFEEEIENIKKELNESQLKCLNLTSKLKVISDFQAQKFRSYMNTLCKWSQMIKMHIKNYFNAKLKSWN
ncbi:golgin subfamily A member 4 [Caerostris extrusa]|uniref:Golgin subfamily A member 4 n=1 Tax=Caerostris extrusa TaxID=172846 RepID=A0AAV4SWL7_CAEEX|nr:golgin subfamily A member 4 [Caerostris extrusa]